MYVEVGFSETLYFMWSNFQPTLSLRDIQTCTAAQHHSAAAFSVMKPRDRFINKRY